MTCDVTEAPRFQFPTMLFKRLYRRVRWLLLSQWRTLSLAAWEYESCQHCGKSFRVRWTVQDQYWLAVVGVEDSGGGSYCVDCFVELALRRGVNVPEDAYEIDVFIPERFEDSDA